MTFEKIITDGNYHLIDVRQPMELELDGAINGAVNIPLATVPLKLDEIKELQGPKIVFCRSGGRSGQAIQYLTENGVDELFNGGGFMQLQMLLDNYKK